MRIFSKKKYLEYMKVFNIGCPNWVNVCDGKEIYINSNGGRRIQTEKARKDLHDFGSFEDWEVEVDESHKIHLEERKNNRWGHNHHRRH